MKALAISQWLFTLGGEGSGHHGYCGAKYFEALTREMSGREFHDIQSYSRGSIKTLYMGHPVDFPPRPASKPPPPGQWFSDLNISETSDPRRGYEGARAGVGTG